MASLELAPAGCEDIIVASLTAPQAFVRAQAAKACIAIPLAKVEGPLTRALGDSDWWVRKNSAASLAAFGPSGKVVLRTAAVSHADQFARESARRASR